MKVVNASFLHSVAKDLLEIYSKEEAREFQVSVFIVEDVREVSWNGDPFRISLVTLSIKGPQFSGGVPRENLEWFLTKGWKSERPLRLPVSLSLYIDLPCGLIEKRLKWMRILSPGIEKGMVYAPGVRSGGLLALYPPYIVQTIIPLGFRGRVNVTVADFKNHLWVFSEVWMPLLRVLSSMVGWKGVSPI